MNNPRAHDYQPTPSHINTAKDPVCGMMVGPSNTAHHADHGGHTYHLCSAGRRTKFVADPDAKDSGLKLQSASQLWRTFLASALDGTSAVVRRKGTNPSLPWSERLRLGPARLTLRGGKSRRCSLPFRRDPRRDLGQSRHGYHVRSGQAFPRKPLNSLPADCLASL